MGQGIEDVQGLVWEGKEVEEGNNVWCFLAYSAHKIIVGKCRRRAAPIEGVALLSKP